MLPECSTLLNERRLGTCAIGQSCEPVRNLAGRLNPLASEHFSRPRYEFPPATVIRTDALQPKRSRSLVAYGAPKLTARRIVHRNLPRLSSLWVDEAYSHFTRFVHRTRSRYPPSFRFPAGEPVRCLHGNRRRTRGTVAVGGVDPHINGEQRGAGTTRCGNGRQEATSGQAASRLLRCASALRVTRRNHLTHQVFMAGSELPTTSGPTCENTSDQGVNPHMLCAPFIRTFSQPLTTVASHREIAREGASSRV